MTHPNEYTQDEAENIHVDENGTDLSQAELLVDSHHGIYIPQFFTEQFIDQLREQHIEADTLESLLAGPDDEWYWEAWDTTLSNATVKVEGKVYSLYHNEDLFGIPYLQ